MHSELLEALSHLQCSVERLERKVQKIEERTRGCSTTSPIPSSAPQDAVQDMARVQKTCSEGHGASAFSLDASAPSSFVGEMQAPRQRMLETYKRIFFDVVPTSQTLNTGGPIGEARILGVRATQRQRTLLQLPKSASLRSLLASPGAVDMYYADESEMWRTLKASAFYEDMHYCVALGTPLPFSSWLRLLMHVPGNMRMGELARVFDEEDTVTALSSLVQVSIEGYWAVPHLVLFTTMHPTSAIRSSWDTYILMLLFSVCIITPYMICFDVAAPVLSPLGFWEVIMDASFILDVVLNFRTAYIRSEFLVTAPRDIAAHYFKGFFTIDVLSTIPWDIVLMNETLGLVQLFKATKMIKLVRIIRVLKLVRVLRLLKAPTVIRHLEMRMGRVVVRIVSLVCIVIFILHIFACLFHSVAVWNDDSNSWVEASGIVNKNSQVDRYVTSMYWAMSTMATVGYGDVTPVHFSEKIVAMVGMLVGVTIFAYIMSTVSSLLSTFNAQSIRAQETQRQLDSFCRAHQLPTSLARKLGTYYDYVLPRTVHSEDQRLVQGLSGALQQQVLLTLHAQLFDKLPFFRDQPAQFLQNLLPELKLEYYAPNEYVLWQGDVSTEMYFITHGMLEVRLNVDCDLPECDDQVLATDAAASGKWSRSSGGMVQRAAAMWKDRENNPNLRQRPSESTSAPGSQPGKRIRRLNVKPLQQIQKPLSLLTHAVHHIIHSGTATLLGAAASSRVHDAPRSSVARDVFPDIGGSGRPATNLSYQQPPVQLWRNGTQKIRFTDQVKPDGGVHTGPGPAMAATSVAEATEAPSPHSVASTESRASASPFELTAVLTMEDRDKERKVALISDVTPATDPTSNKMHPVVQEDCPHCVETAAPVVSTQAQDVDTAHTATETANDSSPPTVEQDSLLMSGVRRKPTAVTRQDAQLQSLDEMIGHGAEELLGTTGHNGISALSKDDQVLEGGDAMGRSQPAQESGHPPLGQQQTLSTEPECKREENEKLNTEREYVRYQSSESTASQRQHRSHAAKELVNRMIGVQSFPYRRIGRLGPGQYFGERACWTGQNRTASVVTITSAELYCLKQSTLQAAAKLWPDLQQQLSQPVFNRRLDDKGSSALRRAEHGGYRSFRRRDSTKSHIDTDQLEKCSESSDCSDANATASMQAGPSASPPRAPLSPRSHRSFIGQTTGFHHVGKSNSSSG